MISRRARVRFVLGAVFTTAVFVRTAHAQDAALAPFQFGAFEREIAGFNHPVAIATDEHGSIFVADAFGCAITVCARDGKPIAQWGAFNNAPRPGEFVSPRGIAVHNDEVFVTDAGAHNVQVFDKRGAPLRQWGGHGVMASQFNQPCGVAADANHVYVADSGNNRVQVFDRLGTFIQSLQGEAENDESHLIEPVDVAVDETGAVYIADAGQHRIVKFDARGGFVKSWGEWGPFPGFLDEPTGIEYRSGRLYVTDHRNHRVQVFDRNGKFIEEWGVHELIPHEGNGKLHYPNQLAIAPDGTWAAIVEAVEDRVQIFAALPVGASPEPPVMYNRAGQTHFGEHISADGQLMVVAEPENHFVFVFETSTDIPVILNQFGERGDKFGLLLRTAGIHLDFKQREILVSDSGTNRLQQYNVDFDPKAPRNMNPEMTRFSTSWDFEHLRSHMPDPKPASPIKPAAIKRDARGNLHVVDSRNNRIHVFDPHMKFVGGFGEFGAASGKLRSPADVSFSKSGEEVFVVDSLNRRVQVFDRNGTFKAMWESPHSDAWTFVQPFGITSGRDGFVYVTDVGSNSILKFTESGQLVKQWGMRGSKVDELWKPRGITQDERLRLIVVDHGNHRAQIYDADGNWLVTFGAGKAYTEQNKPRERPKGS